MKDEIQQRRHRQYAGLSDEQIRQRMREALATSSDPAARKWREIAAAEPKGAQSADRNDVDSGACRI
ncbi:MAG: hypothetical protein JXA69_08755 [Phycisphaerae bacterium]|nr:hypothetical protein [Phycisphaerae bacterium]